MHRAAASIDINEKILDIYLKQFLPLLAVPGDDGNYAATASSDLECLQVCAMAIEIMLFLGVPISYSDKSKCH